jgi:hypothetical protein
MAKGKYKNKGSSVKKPSVVVEPQAANLGATQETATSATAVASVEIEKPVRDLFIDNFRAWFIIFMSHFTFILLLVGGTFFEVHSHTARIGLGDTAMAVFMFIAVVTLHGGYGRKVEKVGKKKYASAMRQRGLLLLGFNIVFIYLFSTIESLIGGFLRTPGGGIFQDFLSSSTMMIWNIYAYLGAMFLLSSFFIHLSNKRKLIVGILLIVIYQVLFYFDIQAIVGRALVIETEPGVREYGYLYGGPLGALITTGVLLVSFVILDFIKRDKKKTFLVAAPFVLLTGLSVALNLHHYDTPFHEVSQIVRVFMYIGADFSLGFVMGMFAIPLVIYLIVVLINPYIKREYAYIKYISRNAILAQVLGERIMFMLAIPLIIYLSQSFEMGMMVFFGILTMAVGNVLVYFFFGFLYKRRWFLKI